ncbi:ABC transporter G family member 7 [Hibiscus syriacus]|uniref:ABC transporter G family member 7 n=1 Tax=Hibiscus syriacus TaxID=106335 RepID=A0A6A3A759_HIBSY|nr:ABC transporter G family member 7 [Hibiscus syriacus]
MPSKTLGNISPYQKLYDKPPNYRFLKIFGCQCFPNLRVFNTYKLDFRFKACGFLGYSRMHHGYQCMDEHGRIYVSRSVVFSEYIFPFSHKAVTHKKYDDEAIRSWVVPVVSNPHKQTRTVPRLGTNTDVSIGQGVEASSASLPAATGNELHMHSGEHSVNNEPGSPTHEFAVDVSSQQEQSASAEQEQSSSTEQVQNPETVPATRVSNTHSMITRSKHGIFKPKIYSVQCKAVPGDIRATLKDDDWRMAVMAEYNTLISNNTLDIVELPPGRKAIGCKWLFKVKKNVDGSVERLKARLIAKGYSQIPGYDFMDTFSPVVRFFTVNILISLVVSCHWQIRQVDVNNAFLKSDLSEDVYMQQVPGFEEQSNGVVLVCKLKKALYGLRQAPRNWFLKLRDLLLSLRFKPSRANSSLFIRQEDHEVVYMVVYVDDILITCSSQLEVDRIVHALHEKFSLKDLGQLKYFLGIEVHRSNNGLFLSQKKFITELLHKNQMSSVNSTSTPMATTTKLSKNDGEVLNKPQQYRSAVGALQYIFHTRPDISFAVNKVAKFLQEPIEVHWLAVKRILRYLRGTLETGLWFLTQAQKLVTLNAFSDSDWGGDVDDRRSTAEAEYMSLTDVTSEVVWIKAVLQEMHIALPEEPKLWCDNTSAIDAFQAEQVMETLRLLAQDGHTIICSIHQPRGSVYGKFDDIVLLTEGTLVYAGPAHDQPLEYFSRFGLWKLSNNSVPESEIMRLMLEYWLVNSILNTIISGSLHHFTYRKDWSEAWHEVLQENYCEEEMGLVETVLVASKTCMDASCACIQNDPNFCSLLSIEKMVNQAPRDGPTNKVRARMSIASAIIFGSVFWRMGRSQTSIQDRMRLLQVTAINTAMAALTKTLGVFPKERAIVDRERSKGSYALGPYLLSKLIAEIPVGAAFPLMFGTLLLAASAMGLTVGAMVPTTEAAMALGPSLMTAFQGFCVNEFTGLKFDRQHSFDIQAGEQALERYSLGGSPISDTIIAQIRILLFWYSTTYILLEKNKPKYLQLKEPAYEQTEPKLKLEPLLETNQPPPIKQDEQNEQLESLLVDRIEPFVLEGL